MWGRRQPRPIWISTRDGWKLAAYRNWGSEKSTSHFGPVVLVHGLGANRANLDAPDARISVARYLAERGHDTWVIELRGAGRSRPPGWPLQRRASYDFDDYVHLDVPSFMRRILDETGSSALHWVGHSMGGMLAYAALEHFSQHLFRSVTTVASPGFTGVRHPLVDRAHRLRFLLRVLPWLPYRRASYLASFFPGVIERIVGPMVSAPGQLERNQIRELARTAVDDLPSTLIAQFADWYGDRTGFRRGDGLLEYYEHLGRIQAPVLILAGAGDRLTPLADLVQVFERIGSREKELVICGREQGFGHDYGHIDMILGARAPDEVYPRIAAWIESHA